jgi:hypothetical protein
MTTRGGGHAETLRRLVASFAQADQAARDRNGYFMTMFEWRQLIEVYAPAREAMKLARDQQAARLLGGDFYFGAPGERWAPARFQIIAEMNEHLQDSRSTYEVFLQLRDLQPELARLYAFLALPAIVEAGDYTLAENYLDDPLNQLDALNQHARQYTLLPEKGEPPRLWGKLHHFARDVALLCAVQRGLGREAEAAALHSAALAGLETDELRVLVQREMAEPGVLSRELAALEAERD